jgi:multidrug/hemolysin transport system permease protein
MGNLITDLEQSKLDAFLVTPVKRYKIILSYYISAILVTSVLSIFMWIMTIVYVGLSTSNWYPLDTILIVTLVLILFTFISASLMIYLVTLLKSVNAFGALLGILGTFVGFMSGIYMPLVVLGKSMRYVASVIPFTHMSILLKRILLEGPYEMMIEKGVPLEVMPDIKEAYGSEYIGVLGLDISITWIMLASILLSILFLFFAYRNMTKKMVK